MPYLITADYKQLIQDANLQQIISNDATILSRAELTAQAEAISYLRQKYDITQEFTNTQPYSPAAIYKAKDRVVNANVIYYAKLPYPEFDFNGVYNIGDRVFWKNFVYTCLVQTPVLGHDAGLQYRLIENLPLANIAPDNTSEGSKYWGDKTAYSVPIGGISNTTYFIQGDNRDQQMVTYLIDITLYHVHSRIAPRNIPDLRVKRYEDAIAWLQMCAKGEITPNLPLIQPRQGNRIRFGGQIKNINSY